MLYFTRRLTPDATILFTFITATTAMSFRQRHADTFFFTPLLFDSVIIA